MFRGGHYNVYRRTVRGVAGAEQKLPLDSAKIEQIRKHIETIVPHGSKSEEEWKKCYAQINYLLLIFKTKKINSNFLKFVIKNLKSNF